MPSCSRSLAVSEPPCTMPNKRTSSRRGTGTRMIKPKTHMSKSLAWLIDGHVHDGPSGEVHGGEVNFPGNPLRYAAQVETALLPTKARQRQQQTNHRQIIAPPAITTAAGVGARDTAARGEIVGLASSLGMNWEKKYGHTPYENNISLERVRAIVAVAYLMANVM